ncbi:MAG: glycosyltransferase [Calditrichaeota bacterium]|nr:MAG: glycosyltransferase [Calditrichota bacterium]
MKRTDTKLCSSVVLLGGYPPPVGGITIHVKRLHQLCLQNQITCCVLNHLGSKPFGQPQSGILAVSGNRVLKLIKLAFLLHQSKSSIVHIHVSKFDSIFFGMPFLLGATLRKKRILTIHSGAFVASYSSNKIKRYLLKRILKQFTKIIPVNSEQQQFLRDYLKLGSRITEIIPSYILPDINSINKVDPSIKEKIEKFRKEHTIVLMISGMVLPHYGYELLIEVVKSLPMKNHIGVIFSFYGEVDKEYKTTLLKKINSIHHLIFDENLQEENFLYVLKSVDVYVRPTTVDSVGVVVAEALTLRVPVLASDVCFRPPGTILFKSSDKKDLKERLVFILQNKEKVQQSLKAIQLPNYGENIINIYKELLNIPKT